MREQTQKIALCGMTAALGVVVMVLGAALGLGTYVSPMLAGLCLIPIGDRWGGKYQALLWIAVGTLCLMLVTDAEENLMFIGLFGWYPILRPRLQRLPRTPRLIVKLVIFNAVIVALEALVVLVLAPESMEVWLIAALLALGNVTFLLYDRLIPIFSAMAGRYLGRFLPKN